MKDFGPYHCPNLGIEVVTSRTCTAMDGGEHL